MPAFNVTKRRKRRRPIDAIKVIAAKVGIHERTLRRWIVERPELRPVLRAYRHGKQWRLDAPKNWAEFEAYKREVELAISPFHRRRKKHWERTTIGKEIAVKWGYGNKERERDLLILRAAKELKIANPTKTSVSKAKSKLAEKIGKFDTASDWVWEIRIISAKYGCTVFDVPKYLDRWIAEDPTRERKNTARRIRQSWPTTAQLNKASGLWKSQWRKRTLNAATRELADLGERINGTNLARFLFLNEYREHAWKTNEKQKQFQKDTGTSVWLDPYGKKPRGISLRLFRQRYDRKDIQSAKAVIEEALRSELENKPERADRAASPRRLWIDTGS
jgi:hypothetical protein